jgi:hypothetical protein
LIGLADFTKSTRFHQHTGRIASSWRKETSFILGVRGARLFSCEPRLRVRGLSLANLTFAERLDDAVRGTLHVLARQPLERFAVTRRKGVDQALVLVLSFREAAGQTDLHPDIRFSERADYLQDTQVVPPASDRQQYVVQFVVQVEPALLVSRIRAHFQ